MMFRRLYWVTEELDSASCSRVTGVYTSIPDLIRKGLSPIEDQDERRIRLNLIKLDCSDDPLGTWESPGFEGIQDRLGEFVATDEFTQEQCQSLFDELSRFRGLQESRTH
jgi:hypothetical protein